MSSWHLLRAAASAAALALLVSADVCPSPPPAKDFANFSYGGTWYEIAKAQTIGGAIFESSCVCTELIVTPANDTVPSDMNVLNSCRQHTPSGSFLNASATLVLERAPGWWEEEFIPGLPTVNYTVIAIGEDYAVEFDCGEIFGIVNYCVHIMSRTPTMDPALQASLIAFANNTLALNQYNLPYNQTHQEGCW
jgi:lipocalin